MYFIFIFFYTRGIPIVFRTIVYSCLVKVKLLKKLGWNQGGGDFFRYFIKYFKKYKKLGYYMVKYFSTNWYMEWYQWLKQAPPPHPPWRMCGCASVEVWAYLGLKSSVVIVNKLSGLSNKPFKSFQQDRGKCFFIT